ncbi:MAG: hypothetical protein WDO72_10125 [Pseudomonadota bacterium]
MRLLPLLALLGTAAAQAAIADKPGIPQVRVEVSRRGDEWSAEFQFDRRVAAWVLPRSDRTALAGTPWREGSWTVETRGVKLARHGAYDVFEADRGELPLRVRIGFTPVAERLQADYPPALRFTDGSVALFVAQFDLFPMDSLAKVRALPNDLNNQMVPAAQLRYVFVDSAGPVLLEGRRAAVASTIDKDTYVLFGATRPIETPYMVAVLDPELPAWIKDSISTAVPSLLSRYTQELGKLPDGKPTIMVSWAGPTPYLVSRAGSALHGLIVMTYEGTGMLNETPEQRAQGLWFVAHEAAHFWLGQTVSYQYARDAWITEGGADLLAIRAVAEADPTYDPRMELNRAIEDCISLTRRKGVASARERNEHRAYYACGAVFGLVAEAGSGRSFYKFVRALLDANRADGIVSRAEWLAALDAATRKPDLSRDIAHLLDRGAPEPEDFIADLLGRAGVDFTLDTAGVPKLR